MREKIKWKNSALGTDRDINMNKGALMMWLVGILESKQTSGNGLTFYLYYSTLI